MTIDLYINHSQNNVMNKITSLLKNDVDVQPYNNVTILNPSFILDYKEEFLKCNYIYVHELNRFYYVTATLSPAGKITFICRVDVLMSWRVMLLTSTGCATRSAAFMNKGTFINDDKYPVSKEVFMKSYEFPNQPFFYSDEDLDRRIILEVRN